MLSRTRSRWFLVVLWLVAASIAGGFQGRLNDEVTTDNRLFLPDAAEATEARDFIERRFAGGDEATALVVHHRDEGLDAADEAVIAERSAFIERVESVRRVAPAEASEQGSTAVTAVAMRQGDSRDIRTTIAEIRDIATTNGGLEAAVTGAPAVTADAVEQFGSIDLPLLLGTAALVLAVLLLIYRSPLLALVPFVVVAAAYAVAVGLVYALMQAGLTVDGQSTALLVVLMFGAGTDYCLLLLARFRDELAGSEEDPADAMRRALRRVGPTIVASGMTVIAGLLTLLLASLGSMRALGPVCAAGVLVVLVASLTLLPAILLLVGPRKLRLTTPRATRRQRIDGLARRVVAHPARTVVVTTASLSICALGILAYEPDTNLLGGFRAPTESARGLELVQLGFPAGRLAPVAVVAPQTTTEQVAHVRAVAADTGGVADVGDAVATEDGDGARFDVVLEDDPYADGALATVERLRARLPAAMSGAPVLIGGTSAVQLDLRDAAADDLLLIAPVALLVIAVIVMLLLRAVPAALLALATVLLSFTAALGASLVLLRTLLGQDGMEPTVPLFAFVFLVALGVDYTIFLLGRIREEAEAAAPREAVVRGLSRTGGVITSAGLVLAGTFAVLVAFPLDAMLQLGFTVALGVVLDTFVVRTLLLPGGLALLRERAWWPGRSAETARKPA